MSDWQSLPVMGRAGPGQVVQGGAGGQGLTAQALRFRDPVDAARAMVGRVPSAEYPDGYLGNVRSRREDRVLDTIKNRLNDRGYQRGVHKGERIEPDDYFWPGGFSNESGIARQAAAMPNMADPADRKYYAERFAPAGTVVERLTLLHERIPGLAARVPTPGEINRLNRLRPTWT